MLAARLSCRPANIKHYLLLPITIIIIIIYYYIIVIIIICYDNLLYGASRAICE